MDMVEELKNISMDKTQPVQRIWNILNCFRLKHFFIQSRDMIEIGDFDEMMEKIQQELLSFENEKEPKESPAG